LENFDSSTELPSCWTSFRGTNGVGTGFDWLITTAAANSEGTRDYYQNFADKLGPEGIREGQLASNMSSIDGLPGLSKPSL
ncbi:MAG: hypothetical protein AAGG11_21575, partial [Pseudomonadota bacterium]